MALTNPVERRRQGLDRTQSIRGLQDQQEQALTALMQGDREARDLYWRGKQLEMDHAAHASRMRTEDEEFRHREELHPLQLARAEAAAATVRAKAKGLESAQLLKAETARRSIEDTGAFQQKMLDAIRNGAVPRTEAFRNLLLSTRLEHPWMDPSHYGDFWKAHSGSPEDPEEAVRGFQLARVTAPAQNQTPGSLQAGLSGDPAQSAEDEAAPRPPSPPFELTPEQRAQEEKALRPDRLGPGATRQVINPDGSSTLTFEEGLEVPSAAEAAMRAIYTSAAVAGDLANAHEWSKPADDQHVTAHQLFYQWVHGLGSSHRKFDENSWMGKCELQADYVVNGMNKMLEQIRATGSLEPVGVIHSLGGDPYWLDFPNEFVTDAVLGSNPARGYQGSIRGKVLASEPFMREGRKMVTLNIQLEDDSTAISATHLPPIRFGKWKIIEYGPAVISRENP